MHHMGVALDPHERGEPHATEFGHPSHIVPPQIDQHEVLGPLLRIGRQLLGQGNVLFRRAAAWTGAGNRSNRDLRILDPDQYFGRASDDVDVVAMEIVKIGRRVQRPQVAIRQKRIRCGQVQSPGKDGLKGVSGGDVLPDPAHVVLEAAIRVGTGGRRQLRHRFDLERAYRYRCGQALEPAFDPGAGAIVQPAHLFR
jgi:hypothetical protein